MNVLVDTTILSLALRRKSTSLSAKDGALVREWEELVREGHVLLLGVVRQELLSGIPEGRTFRKVRDLLRAFDDEPLTSEDHEYAAVCFNRCRTKGIQGSVVDMLICAVAERRGASVFTTDADFRRYAKYLPFALHSPRR
jgi:predicted nucleic acid-binding protein